MECKWLPDFYAAPDWSDYAAFEDELYKFFRMLYLTNPIQFRNIIVKYRHQPFYNGREEIFYHLTCKKYEAGNERCPDPERIIRIAWPKSFIENHVCFENCCHEKPLYWIKAYKTVPRHKILFDRFLVILEERQGYFLLVTGFLVEQEYYLRDLKKEANECQ